MPRDGFSYRPDTKVLAPARKWQWDCPNTSENVDLCTNFRGTVGRRAITCVRVAAVPPTAGFGRRVLHGPIPRA
ncbi:hypothetical protein GCM10010278_38420 [Streptomyces melanogenes]|nr:hypothetical protein GCM10010278_38420 [Streptomyces melanogenes]